MRHREEGDARTRSFHGIDLRHGEAQAIGIPYVAKAGELSRERLAGASS
jgi:hypothetical protein